MELNKDMQLYFIYISKCNTFIEKYSNIDTVYLSNNLNTILLESEILQNEIVGNFSILIPDINKVIKNNNTLMYAFINIITLRNNLVSHLRKIKFNENDLVNKRMKNLQAITIENNINIQIDITMSINKLKSQYADNQEILETVNEIEEIANSREDELTKWDKAKSVLNKVTKEGWEVGKSLLPVLFQAYLMNPPQP